MMQDDSHLYDRALFERAIDACTPPDERARWLFLLKCLTAWALLVGADPRESGLRWSERWGGWSESSKKDKPQIRAACKSSQEFGNQAACAQEFLTFSGVRWGALAKSEPRSPVPAPARVSKADQQAKRKSAQKAVERRKKNQTNQLARLIADRTGKPELTPYWKAKQRAAGDSPLPLPAEWRASTGIWREFPDGKDKGGAWWRDNLVIPLYELTPKRRLRTVGVQIICGSSKSKDYQTGDKFFPAGTPLLGHFHSFPGCGTALEKGAPLILVEGAITGLAAAHCTDFKAPIVCCFSVSTTASVAAAFRAHFPELEIVLLPDTGEAYRLCMELVHGDREKGIESRLGNASVIDLFPLLPDARENGDFFDVYARHGKEYSLAHLRQLVRVARSHKSPILTR